MSTGHEGAHQRDADRAGSSRKKYVHDVVLTHRDAYQMPAPTPIASVNGNEASLQTAEYCRAVGTRIFVTLGGRCAAAKTASKARPAKFASFAATLALE